MLKFLLGSFLGATISLFLYACIIVGKQAYREIEFENEEVNSE